MNKKIKALFYKILFRFLNGLSDVEKASLFEHFKKAYQMTIYDTYRIKYKLHNSFRFNGEGILFYGNGEIIAGENSYIGNHSTAQVEIGKKIVIGNNCSISHNVRMYTSSAEPNQNFNISTAKSKKSGDIIIQDGVWIGANVFINPGITIGENSIIGANSVLTKNVEPFAIYGGVPAKLIKHKNNA